VPLLPGVLECVGRGVFPGAIERNRESSEDRAVGGENVTRAMLDICFDAQTSGGLLVALPAARAADFIASLTRSGVVGAAVIGKVTSAGAGRVFIETKGTRTIPVSKEGDEMREPSIPARPRQPADEPACCEGEPAESAAAAGAPAEDEACCAGETALVSRAQAGGAEEAFKAFMKRAGAPGALDIATKQAMNIALSLVTRCGPCTKAHIKKAREMGFTEEEIDEAAWMAVSFGGCSVMMFYNQFRN